MCPITKPLVEQATLSDLEALCALEHRSFVPERQEGTSSIKRSLTSPHQETWLIRANRADAKAEALHGRRGCYLSQRIPRTVDAKTEAAAAIFANTPLSIAGACVLRVFPKTLRIYSIAVASEHRGKGYGQLLLDHSIARARKLGKVAASLEADASNPALIRWYTANGFTVTKTLKDYYGKRQNAVRMRLRI